MRQNGHGSVSEAWVTGTEMNDTAIARKSGLSDSPEKTPNLLDGKWPVPVPLIDSCLSRLGKPFIYFFLVGEQLLDARALLHTLEMRSHVGEI